MQSENFYKIELPFEKGTKYLNLDIDENLHLDDEHHTSFTLAEIYKNPTLNIFQDYAKIDKVN